MTEFSFLYQISAKMKIQSVLQFGTFRRFDFLFKSYKRADCIFGAKYPLTKCKIYLHVYICFHTSRRNLCRTCRTFASPPDNRQPARIKILTCL